MARKLITYRERFFSNSTAMAVELSINGFFIELAKVKGKNQAGDNIYDWDNARKISPEAWEISTLYEGLLIYRNGGPEEYKKKVRSLSVSSQYPDGNPKYTNVQFVHEHEGKVRRFGWALNSSNKLQFIIYDKDNMFYPIQTPDMDKLIHYLEFIIKLSFHYRGLLLEDKRLEAIKAKKEKERDLGYGK